MLRRLLDLIPTQALLLAICVVAVPVVLLAAWQMWRGDALICSDGAVFARSCKLNPTEIVLDSAVVAFSEDKCPRGWRDYSAGAGRFIVGTGRHAEGVPPLRLEASGGSRTHKLTVSEMPRHSHKGAWSSGYDSPEHTDYSADEFGDKDAERHTTPAGEGMPHNNMPPYIALSLCEFIGLRQ